ncbi:hypothetical protein GCM10007989_25220 [Devosia pacifica]|uniref:Zinc-ribbon domain-containing protein n=1 Tax=Devosia pacifica TaxID=1335967 RepID=A0A918S843_9HYPH|nr:putative zinc-binding peptidase [Devosia pacifica]GHA28157.1 hypothetical protein GCM10007989_25220 [Devosia pacifica]
MKLFTCDHCGNTVYFENALCEACGHLLGYLPRENMMIALKADNGVYRSVTVPDNTYVYCDNARHDACNWLIDAQPDGDIYCLACRHNETVPDLSVPDHLHQWQVIERAKKRLFYSLLRLGLPLETRAENPQHGLAFDFLAEARGNGEQVMTGHDRGYITLALAEADDAERERRRAAMGEPYRTLLGHFRHEIGHHYWDLLVEGHLVLEEFRRVFGDETEDYGDALKRHYANGAPADWPQNFISAYATSHPWEDFAECWAHYLHITDTLETASQYQVEVHPPHGGDTALRAGYDPYQAQSFEQIAASWIPLAGLTNSLNRSMGLADAYPFVLTPEVIKKLALVHRIVHGNTAGDSNAR